MGVGRNIGLGLLAVVLVGAGVVAVRTAAFKAPGQTDLKTVRLSAPIAIDANRAAGHLGEAIRFQTVTHQDPSTDQLDQWDKLHAWLIATYPAAHRVMSREVVGGHALIYTWKGSDPSLAPIMLMAHQDVVPVAPGTQAAWRHPPFSGALAEGYIWGHGAYDDKGALVSIMEALDALAAKGFQPKRTIILVSGCNEETRGGSARVAADLLQARGVKAEFLLDEGFSGTTKDAFTGKPMARLLIAEKGYGTLRLTARAAGGHSSTPPRDNAVVTLSKAVVAIAAKPYPMRLTGPVKASYQALAPQVSWRKRMMLANIWLFGPWLVDEISAQPAGAAVLHTTIAPTMLEASAKENVLAQTATARINFRIAPGDTTARVMRRSRSAIGKLPIELSWEKPPFEPTGVSSTQSRGWKLINATVAETFHVPVAPGLMRAGTDSWFLRGVARDIYLFTPMLLTADEEKMIHGTNERISVRNLEDMIQFYARLVESSAG